MVQNLLTLKHLPLIYNPVQMFWFKLFLYSLFKAKCWTFVCVKSWHVNQQSRPSEEVFIYSIRPGSHGLVCCWCVCEREGTGQGPHLTTCYSPSMYYIWTKKEKVTPNNTHTPNRDSWTFAETVPCLVCMCKKIPIWFYFNICVQHTSMSVIACTFLGYVCAWCRVFF